MVSSRAPRSNPRPCGNQSNGSSSHWPSFHSEQQISPQNDKSVDSSQPQLTVTPPFLFPSQDKITSVVIPMGFAVASLGLLVKGIDDLSWGKNRKEGF